MAKNATMILLPPADTFWIIAEFLPITSHIYLSKALDGTLSHDAIMNTEDYLLTGTAISRFPHRAYEILNAIPVYEDRMCIVPPLRAIMRMYRSAATLGVYSRDANRYIFERSRGVCENSVLNDTSIFDMVRMKGHVDEYMRTGRKRTDILPGVRFDPRRVIGLRHRVGTAPSVRITCNDVFDYDESTKHPSNYLIDMSDPNECHAIITAALTDIDMYELRNIVTIPSIRRMIIKANDDGLIREFVRVTGCYGWLWKIYGNPAATAMKKERASWSEETRKLMEEDGM